MSNLFRLTSMRKRLRPLVLGLSRTLWVLGVVRCRDLNQYAHRQLFLVFKILPQMILVQSRRKNESLGALLGRLDCWIWIWERTLPWMRLLWLVKLCLGSFCRSQGRWSWPQEVGWRGLEGNVGIFPCFIYSFAWLIVIQVNLWVGCTKYF